MFATAIPGESTASADSRAEDHFPWDIEAAPSVVESDTWLLSFIDILTLLLALFVLLLVQEHQRNVSLDNEITVQPARALMAPEPEPPTLELRPFSTIQLPALPQIVSPLDSLQIPAYKKTKHPEEPVSLPVEAVVHTPVDDFLETLRTSGLADRLDIQARTDSIRLDITDSILFAPARTTLTDSGLTLLGELAVTLKDLQWSLSVEGHTDNIPIQTPRFPSNWELSTARATVVARELIRHGIPPDRIRAIGYADTQPRDSNETPEGRNRNRRVTFVLELPARSNEQ